MRKIIRGLFIMATLICVCGMTAFAASSGIDALYVANDNVSIIPQTADGMSVEITDSGVDYPNAERLQMTVNDLTDGEQLLVMVVEGDAEPSEENIVYIDQQEAKADEESSNAVVVFNLYPKQLIENNTYYIYLSRTESARELVAQFEYVGTEAKVEIKTQPADTSANVGDTAKFTVTATGSGLKYQWQYSKDSGKTWYDSPAEGNTTSTVSIYVADYKNGYQYRCVVTDSNKKSVTSSYAMLTVTAAGPAITKQPVAVSAKVDETAKFTVTSTGSGLKYQWQYSIDNGNTWYNSPAEGNSTSTVSIYVADYKNGYQYRCVITDSNGKTVTSNAAKLTVLPAITKQPVGVSAKVDATAKFTVTATGTSLKYQWQYSTDSGKTWYDSPAEGNTTSVVSIYVYENKNGYLYRCVITDSNKKTVTSNAAKLTVLPAITKQPVGVSAKVDATAKFTVTANGVGLKYQWQYSKDSGKTWYDSPAEGNTSNTVSIYVTANKNSYLYRCVITDGNGKTITSNAAKLTVTAVAPTITKQPLNASAEAGDTAKFTVTATGISLKYQWQYSKDDGKTWTNSPATGSTTATVSITMAAYKNGYQYRCVITDSNGKTVTSNAAKLTVTAAAPTITKQPSNASAEAGDTAKFTVTATGIGLKYQWQYSKDDGKTWTNSPATGSTTATVSITMATYKNGYQYRCVITDSNGKTVTSNTAKLTVTVSLASTFETDSTTAYNTSESGEMKTETVPICEHDYQITVKEPTCTEAGYTTHTCSKCGESYQDTETAALGHSYEDTITEATCTEAGHITRTCSRCGDSYTDTEVAALGHSFTNYIYNEDAQICKDGSETAVCDFGCGTTDSRTKVGSALPDSNVNNPFIDVAPDQYYYNPILWAVENKITSGTSATAFSPNDICTRAQVVTFLWRAAGEPEPEATSCDYLDVEPGKFYYKAVLWAVENGITDGSPATTFLPNDPCTRAQAVDFQWRAAGKPTPEATGCDYQDVVSGEYYYDAVLWALENNITSGTSKKEFSPDTICSRGQIVTFLYRQYRDK